MRALTMAGGERRAVNHALIAAACLTVCATALFIVPPVLRLVTLDHPSAPRMAALLVPQALPTVMPLALMAGILWTLGRAQASRRQRVLLMFVAAASSTAMFIMLASVIPSSNQAFRVMAFEVFGGDLASHPGIPRGLNELTLPELHPILDPPPQGHAVSEDARRHAFGLLPDDREVVARIYHGRWALSLSPLVLAAFALRLTGRPRRRWWLGLVAVAASVGYVALHDAARIGLPDAVPTVVVAWTPNVVFMLVTLALGGHSRRRAVP